MTSRHGLTESGGGSTLLPLRDVEPMGRKNNNQTVSARRAALEQRMILGHLSLKEQRAFGDAWGVTPRQVRLDLRWVADQWIAQQDETTVDDHRARLLAESNGIKTLALKNGREMVALRTLEFQAQLTGANAPQQVEVIHSVDRGDPEQVAQRVLKALPMACQVLGIPAPELPVLDVQWEEEG